MWQLPAYNIACIPARQPKILASNYHIYVKGAVRWVVKARDPGLKQIGHMTKHHTLITCLGAAPI